MVKQIQAPPTHSHPKESTISQNGGDDRSDFWDTLMCVVHDLRNSLGAMKGYATLMYNELKSDDANFNCTKKIIDCIDGIEYLFQDIQTVARNSKVQFEPVELQQLLRRSVENYQVLKRQNAVKIEEQLPEDSIFVQCSEHMFLRMFQKVLFELSVCYDKIHLEVNEIPDKKVQITFTGYTKMDEVVEVLSEIDNYEIKKTMNELSFLIIKKIAEIHQGELSVEVEDNLCEKYRIEIPIIIEEYVP